MKNKKQKPRLMPSNIGELIREMHQFEIKRGKRPFCILTSHENRDALIQWLDSMPSQLKGFFSLNVNGVPVITPHDIMVL